MSLFTLSMIKILLAAVIVPLLASETPFLFLQHGNKKVPGLPATPIIIPPHMPLLRTNENSEYGLPNLVFVFDPPEDKLPLRSELPQQEGISLLLSQVQPEESHDQLQNRPQQLSSEYIVDIPQDKAIFFISNNVHSLVPLLFPQGGKYSAYIFNQVAYNTTSRTPLVETQYFEVPQSIAPGGTPSALTPDYSSPISLTGKEPAILGVPGSDINKSYNSPEPNIQNSGDKDILQHSSTHSEVYQSLPLHGTYLTSRHQQSNPSIPSGSNLAYVTSDSNTIANVPLLGGLYYPFDQNGGISTVPHPIISTPSQPGPVASTFSNPSGIPLPAVTARPVISSYQLIMKPSTPSLQETITSVPFVFGYSHSEVYGQTSKPEKFQGILPSQSHPNVFDQNTLKRPSNIPIVSQSPMGFILGIPPATDYSKQQLPQANHSNDKPVPLEGMPAAPTLPNLPDFQTEKKIETSSLVRNTETNILSQIPETKFPLLSEDGSNHLVPHETQTGVPQGSSETPTISALSTTVNEVSRTDGNGHYTTSSPTDPIPITYTDGSIAAQPIPITNPDGSTPAAEHPTDEYKETFIAPAMPVFPEISEPLPSVTMSAPYPAETK